MIHITKRGWNHVIKHHTGQQFTGRKSKSRFYSTVDLVDLINKANSELPVPHKGNLQRVFDAGTAIGIDRDTGKATSTVTVFTRPNDDLITMFPGRR